MKLIFLFSILFFSISSFAKLQVIATTSDLGALATAVGGDAIDVISLAKGTQDPHQIEAKPSFMVKMRDADLVIAHGLELESAWLGPLIQGARNPKIAGGKNILELAGQLNPIEVPKGSISRAEGDVHPGGNPHFQLDPERLGKAALLIADKLSQLSPAQASIFQANAKKFQAHMLDKMKEWQARIKKSGIHEIVTYHKSFSYFCDRFGLICQLQLEPKPGIPPTASHLMDVLEQIHQRHLRLVLIENLYDDSVENKLKQDDSKLVIKRVPVSVGGEEQIKSNEDLIEDLVKTVEGATK